MDDDSPINSPSLGLRNTSILPNLGEITPEENSDLSMKPFVEDLSPSPERFVPFGQTRQVSSSMNEKAWLKLNPIIGKRQRRNSSLLGSTDFENFNQIRQFTYGRDGFLQFLHDLFMWPNGLSV